jgi:hypothetical protein
MRRAATLPEDAVRAMRARCAIHARRYDADVGARAFERAVGIVIRQQARQG